MLIRIILILVILIPLFYYIRQDKMIFYPQKLTRAQAEIYRSNHPEIEELSFSSAEGVNLQGWLLRGTENVNGNLIFYYGGNAEEISYWLIDKPSLKSWNIVLMNYRGYGLSEGKPGERELFSDALKLYDHFTSQFASKDSSIALFGRSLGTGTAVHVAASRKANAIILVSPFDSLANVARDFFPFLPINMLLRHRFDSASKAPLIKIPALIMYSPDDQIVTAKHSRELARLLGGDVTTVEFPGKSHDSISEGAKYWETIENYLQKLLMSAPLHSTYSN
jgi:uncharacterized protein